jgi:hypothetical protein
LQNLFRMKVETWSGGDLRTQRAARTLICTFQRRDFLRRYFDSVSVRNLGSEQLIGNNQRLVHRSLRMKLI